MKNNKIVKAAFFGVVASFKIINIFHNIIMNSISKYYGSTEVFGSKYDLLILFICIILFTKNLKKF